MIIPVVVVAKNEAAMLGACLDSLAAAVAFAEARGAIRLPLTVVLDDTTDESATVAASRGVTVLRASGGKVEAQRAGAALPGDFHIFCDADVVVARDTLHALLATMIESPSLRVAFPPRMPVAPRRRTRLARAVHEYNARRGWDDGRGAWFSGKCFAIRGWDVPTRASLAARIAAAPRDRFVDVARGLVADDVYLSRSIVAAHGPGAIRRSDGGMVWFRAPEDLRGMYRYYRRLRRELLRVDRLFPETRPTHARFGRRRTDVARLAAAGPRAIVAHLHFRAAVGICRLLYALDAFYHRRIAATPPDEWPPIADTKRAVFDPRA